MGVRGVIFDLGGTLLALPGADHARVNRDSAVHLRRFLRAAGVTEAQADVAMAEVQAAAAKRRGGRSRAQWTREANLDRALRRCGVRLPPRLIGAAALAWCQAEFPLWRPAEGVRGVLDAVHGAGLRLGLCSNTACHAYILQLVAAHDLGRHLDPVVTSAAVGWRKPDGRAFLPLLTAWGLPPSEVVMVGDDLECDIGGAAALGMRAIWLTAGGGAASASAAAAAARAGRSGAPAAPVPAPRTGAAAAPVPWRIAADLREVPGLIGAAGG